MKREAFLLILVCSVILTACGNQNSKFDYDPELVAFMIQKPANYYGEGQYYHEIQKVEQTHLNKQYLIEASGEIKDNSLGNSMADYNFKYSFLVTDQSVFQSLDNNRLNDSDFKEVELLRLPLKINNSWTFDAVMFNNKKTKMTAEIIYLSDDLNEIKVKYTAKDYVEMRVFRKALGVTDFTKEVAYKEVKAISGFHLETSETQEGFANSKPEITGIQKYEDAFDDFLEVAISQEEHDIILGFNQNYEKKIRLEEDSLLDYIMPESPASEKINNLKVVDVGTFIFIKFKVKSKTTMGDSSIIEVMELYDVGENQSIFNIVTYTLKIYGDRLMVYDFK